MSGSPCLRSWPRSGGWSPARPKSLLKPRAGGCLSTLGRWMELCRGGHEGEEVGCPESQTCLTERREMTGGGGGWGQRRGGQEVGILEAAWGFGKGLTSGRTPGQGPTGAEPRVVGSGWARAPTTLFIFALPPP